jgi:N-acylneuraminate cytidylyltransferase
MRYVALICARGGSKGLKGKNIKLLGGVPLIGLSIMVAKKIDRISRVIVSTDSDIIADVAREYGAEVPFMRPKEMAQDDSSEWLVWRHALDYLKKQKYKIDGLVVLPTTAPLRIPQDVDRCIDDFEKGATDMVITVSDANRNPFFNMIKVDKEGYSSTVISPNNKIFRRQDAPKVFDMTTVAYVAKPEFVYDKEGVFDGKVRSVHISPERAIDIDTMFDFDIAEYLFLKNCKGK